jgi:iron(III) transport system permease protein
MRNSFLFALAGATCATLLGFLIAYITTPVQIRGHKIVDFFATLPSAIPGPVLAVAMIFAWMLPPFRLYNTPWIILVAYVVAFLPYVVRSVSGGLKAAEPQLEEMGWMCGGSWFAVLRNIVVPNVQGTIWTGWLLVFLMAFREIPLSTMLYREGTETVGVLLFHLKTEAGGLEVTSAVALVVMGLTTVGQLLIRRATHRGRPAEVGR